MTNKWLKAERCVVTWLNDLHRAKTEGLMQGPDKKQSPAMRQGTIWTYSNSKGHNQLLQEVQFHQDKEFRFYKAPT